MKKILALIMAALVLMSCAACGKKEEKSKLEEIKESGKLVVGTSADYPPFEFHMEIDGKDTIVGLDIAMCQYIADDLGVELEIVDMAFDNLVMSLQKGEFDLVAASMSKDEKRCGWRLWAVGALWPASSTFSSFSASTGRSAYFLREYLSAHNFSKSIIASCFAVFQ